MSAFGGLYLDDRRGLPNLQNLVGGAGCEQVHGAGDDACPACLMARADARAVVAMEILVEQNEIAPMRVVLELAAAAVPGRGVRDGRRGSS